MFLLILEKQLLMLSHIFCKLFLMGLLKHIKTDNGLAYMSYCFIKFLSDWNISYSTGIPHNSQDQAIVEHTYHTLKNMLFKQKG